MIAWHYTKAVHVRSILRDGVIRPATAFLPEGETPVVWFSTRQHWEPTAGMGHVDAGGLLRTCSMEETARHCGGVWRFGLAITALTPWRELKRATGISPRMARALESAARSHGADPSLWYGSLTPVAVDRCAAQVFDAGEWHDAPDR
jgi:hypothetical protein